MGVSDQTSTVWEHVHGCTPDEGSNMLKAWRIFEGAACVCHRANNCLKNGQKDGLIAYVVKAVKGLCAHFHTSVKVRTCNGSLEIVMFIL